MILQKNICYDPSAEPSRRLSPNTPSYPGLCCMSYAKFMPTTTIFFLICP